MKEMGINNQSFGNLKDNTSVDPNTLKVYQTQFPTATLEYFLDSR